MVGALPLNLQQNFPNFKFYVELQKIKKSPNMHHLLGAEKPESQVQ